MRITRLLCYEELYSFKVTTLTCIMQWCPTVLIFHLNKAAFLRAEVLDGLKVAIIGGQMERSHLVSGVSFIWIDTTLSHDKLNNVQMTLLACTVNSTSSVLILLCCISTTFLDEELEYVLVSSFGRKLSRSDTGLVFS